MTDSSAGDEKYLELLLAPIRECAKYHPAFGRDSEEGVTLEQFKTFYSADPLYHWIGLDSELMYAAHKAAGGMTSIYRQLGIGCERLLREIIKDQFGITEDEASWSYKYEKEDGKTGTHTLDVLVDANHLRNRTQQKGVLEWLKRAAASLKLPAERSAALRGAVFEIRQGYKSADSKRQNADLRFGLRAYNENYLPVICIVSTQASQTVCRRYSNSQLLVLVGNFEEDIASTFAFFQAVVGYDLPGFFRRNSERLRDEFNEVLKGLLTPA
jgi:hypothetical protein